MADFQYHKRSLYFLPIIFLMSNTFLIWVINIQLLRYFYKPTLPKILQWQGARYVASYIYVFSIFLIIISNAPHPGRIKVVGWYPLVGMFAINTFILLIINLIVTRNEKEELKLQKAQLEISQLTTQQEQLKQQIHPHFLFNALGTLQVLMKKKGGQATDYAGQLAKFLRSSLSIAEQDVMSVQDDLAYFEDYLQLQKMRFGEGIQYQFDIPQEVIEKGRLPVFSLQILAENAIKHNAFSIQSPLFIDIKYEEGLLIITNNLSPKFNQENASGIGLKNLTARFGHFTSHLPEIQMTQHQFKVTIKVLGL